MLRGGSELRGYGSRACAAVPPLRNHGGKVEELICDPREFQRGAVVGVTRRKGRNDDACVLPLELFGEIDEVAVAGDKHDLVYFARHHQPHGVGCNFHVVVCFAASCAISIQSTLDLLLSRVKTGVADCVQDSFEGTERADDMVGRFRDVVVCFDYLGIGERSDVVQNCIVIEGVLADHGAAHVTEVDAVDEDCCPTHEKPPFANWE